MPRANGLLTLAIIMMALAPSLAGCVSASEGRRMRQDIEALDARVAELSSSLSTERARLNELINTAEAEITELQSAIEGAQGLLQRSNVDIGAQVDTLNQDLQNLRGELERSNHDLTQLRTQFELFMEDFYLRMDN